MPNVVDRHNPRLDNPDDWQDGHDANVLPTALPRAFSQLAGPMQVRRLGGGLLHQSFHVRAGGADFVLQKVSSVFAPEIQDNIKAVTEHLGSKAFPTFELCTTNQGALTAEADGRWRLLTHLGGQSFETMTSVKRAQEAGSLVGRFISALSDFDAPLAPLGIPYRDTAAYLKAMHEALVVRSDHRLHADVLPIANEIARAFDELGPAMTSPKVPNRVLHGDLKLANLLFRQSSEDGVGPQEEAFALVDFDTLMRGPLWMDLGDAWRSWCSGTREDDAEAAFDLEIFEASTIGFFSHSRDKVSPAISPAEVDSLVDAPERLALEVCARFVTDALEETYFAWDEQRFPGAGEHHLSRARGQLAFAQATRACRASREPILQQAFKHPVRTD